jgi:hypothetical protein
MTRPAVNVLIVIIAGLVYLTLGFLSGRTAVNAGLGQEGPIYAAMVTDHDMRLASAINRLAPAFPLAAAIPYAATGKIVESLTLVNIVALVLLLLAACLILDAQSAPQMVKVCTVLTLTVLGLPTVTTAFNPGQPDLLGVALVALAVAACEARGGLLVAATQVGATLASPVGIIAPLYGIWRSWRLRRRTPPALMVFVPALLVWVLVQVWARGGPRGLLDLTRLSRVRADAVLWDEFAFILFGLYFLVTSLGGLTILLWSSPRSIASAVREKPELIALVLPVLPFIATAGLDVPSMIPFLLPFWLIVIGVWGRGQTAPLLVPVLLAALLTLLTQHPWVRMNEVNYFVDWFPYSVHAARVSVSANVSDADFNSTWRLRVLMAAGGLAVFEAWRRRSAP